MPLAALVILLGGGCLSLREGDNIGKSSEDLGALKFKCLTCDF